jgi:hypothetical protein
MKQWIQELLDRSQHRDLLHPISKIIIIIIIMKSSENEAIKKITKAEN